MDNNQNGYISKTIKNFFDSNGITQEEIARRLNVSQAYVSSMLNGKPFGKKTANKWGEEFGFRPTFLLTGEGLLLIGQNINDDIKNDSTEEQIKSLISTIDRLSQSEINNSKNISELISQGRQQTDNITRLVDLLCGSGVSVKLNNLQKRGESQYEEGNNGHPHSEAI